MASEVSGSKISIMRIVQVLLRDSSKERPLSQQDILEKMEREYGMVVSRKSVGRNLMRLKDAGFPVMCREVPRVVNGKEAPLSLDWYWDHRLSQEDLQTLIDLLYFSHLPAARVRSLVQTLKHFQSRGYEDGKDFVWNIPLPPCPQVPADTTVPVLEALREKRQISFHYDHYGPDGRRYHNTSPTGTDILYRGSPFRVAASGGRYILLINLDGSAAVSAFYLDRMGDVEILPEAARPQKAVDSLGEGEKLMDILLPVETLYTGSPEHCVFEADLSLMTDVVESFGKAATVKSAAASTVTVEVTIQPAALKAWALARAPKVKVLSPAPLVKEIREAGAALARLYGV